MPFSLALLAKTRKRIVDEIKYKAGIPNPKGPVVNIVEEVKKKMLMREEGRFLAKSN